MIYLQHEGEPWATEFSLVFVFQNTVFTFVFVRCSIFVTYCQGDWLPIRHQGQTYELMAWGTQAVDQTKILTNGQTSLFGLRYIYVVVPTYPQSSWSCGEHSGLESKD